MGDLIATFCKGVNLQQRPQILFPRYEAIRDLDAQTPPSITPTHQGYIKARKASSSPCQTLKFMLFISESLAIAAIFPDGL